jgi:hypothetical protein
MEQDEEVAEEALLPHLHELLALVVEPHGQRRRGGALAHGRQAAGRRGERALFHAEARAHARVAAPDLVLAQLAVRGHQLRMRGQAGRLTHATHEVQLEMHCERMHAGLMRC